VHLNLERARAAADCTSRRWREGLARIKSAGIEVATGPSHTKVAAVAAAIEGARAVSMRINASEWRWLLNTYGDRDAGKLSQALLGRLAEGSRSVLSIGVGSLGHEIGGYFQAASTKFKSKNFDAGGMGGLRSPH